jgi:hypothetical protein
MTFLYEKITLVKSKEVKTRWFNSRKIWQNLFLRKVMAQKRAVLPMIMKIKMINTIITIIMEFIIG